MLKNDEKLSILHIFLMNISFEIAIYFVII